MELMEQNIKIQKDSLMELETISIRERIKQDLADILPLYKLDDLKKLKEELRNFYSGFNSEKKIN